MLITDNCKIVPDHPLFLVAGGPSLQDFDFSRLRKKPNVLAINRSLRALPFARYLYWTDYGFFKDHEKELREHRALYKISPKDTVYKKEYPDWVMQIRFSKKHGLETEPWKVAHGNNSGFAAINLAYHLGAKTVYLLGYDMTFSEKAHHYEEYARPMKLRTLTEKMLPFFETLKEPLAKAGVRIVNLNPNSAIECFEKKSVDEIL